MSGMMPGNIAPAEVSASEIPDGFTMGSSGAAGGAGGASSAAAQKQAQRQSILEQAMTPDALARLNRVKLVKKDRASAVEAMICNMALQNKLDSKVSEAKLIEMLERTSAGASQARGEAAGKISIQRKRYNFDSDSDDENDDDLL